MLTKFTFVYVGLLVALVTLANTGVLSPVLVWLHQLPYGDKACHFVLVGGLSFLISSTLSLRRPRRRYVVVATTIVTIALLTSLEEFSQSMLQYRRFDRLDMLCNIAGTLVFGCATLFIPMRAGDALESDCETGVSI